MIRICCGPQRIDHLARLRTATIEISGGEALLH
jgi:hypothetical protein